MEHRYTTAMSRSRRDETGTEARHGFCSPQRQLPISWCTTCAGPARSSNSTWPAWASARGSPTTWFGRYRAPILSWTSTGRRFESRSTTRSNCSTRSPPTSANCLRLFARLNLDLADLFPPLLDVSEAPATGHELVTQLRLLHSTVRRETRPVRPGAAPRCIRCQRNFR